MSYAKIKQFLLGNPLESQQEHHEKLSIPLAIAVFAADALSSTAFATEEILIAVSASALAGFTHLLSLPVAIAIMVLIIIVSLSYLQVVKAYPENGGTYAVSKDRLGTTASRLAGASLLVDCVLVVAVGVSAGVAAISSTGLVSEHWNVPLAIGFILLVAIINLRGVRESGKALAIPAYLFIGAMTLLVGVGLFHWITHGCQIIKPVGTSASSVSWTNLALIMVIVLLATLSGLLVWLFHADTHALIPLFTISVFLSFTLAQAGVVKYHWQEKQTGWPVSLLINGLGMVTTGVTTLILAYEKFCEGAWIVLLAIPVIMWIFRSIKTHYLEIQKQLTLPEGDYCPVPIEHTVMVLVSSLNRGTVPVLEYAKTISNRVEAVHISLNPKSTEALQKAWDKWGCNIPLVVLHSPYRNLVKPILDYVDEVEHWHEQDLVTIIVPEFVTNKWWHNILHNQSAALIKTLLRTKKESGLNHPLLFG